MKQSEKIVPSVKAKETQQVIEALAQKVTSKNSNIGVDVEDISAVNINNETFVERNFTANEITYCRQAPSPQISFAGRWSAKEAVFKSLGVASQGASAALKDIEIIKGETGAPTVSLHGDAAAAAKKSDVKDITVYISHSDSQAIAVAVTSF
ncbi:Fatty acid synthase subunit alpha [Fusarium keratoplasticum]|uniref:Fatty acid synthase subunit alpha n=1 Tax=Fusarium keratoplasticum TaxID=1328300 RepID=A0ACC0QBC8_9HYPO|nr:Fatty acid synthase subunit alpha [Fusarium keratoplasticum]KAI8648688.1 Fatty acid synthase subunit alpha [Fusarium keratoplasticum]